MTPRGVLATVAWALLLVLAACVAMPGYDPLQVSVADIDSMDGGDLEFRMLVKLRVQNPNDMPVEFSGVYVKMDVMNRTFATGVSDAHGVIPRYGETVIGVPVTVSMLRVGLGALTLLNGAPIERITYHMEGKLEGPAFGSTRFQASGDFAMPGMANP
jgi:LEA14-like dessication related protein